MITNKYLYLALSIVCLSVGLIATGGDSITTKIADGLFKGLSGVFFILYFIFMLLGKQPADKTTH